MAAPGLRLPAEDDRSRDGILRWPVPDELLTGPAVAYRNLFALQLAKRPLEQLVQSYVYLSPAEMERLVRRVCSRLGVRFCGLGLELGGGCGLLGTTVARMPAVRQIYVVEICEQMVLQVIPKVAAGLLGAERRKVVPVFGSFDDLRLPDRSLDFIVEIDSLHHSDDLQRTFRECGRVLKRGGIMVCLDRCQPDSLTDEQIEAMLSRVYSRKFLEANCYPTDAILTRRENGEHEYRLREWRAAFAAGGLRMVAAKRFVKEVRLALGVKGLLRTVLPQRIRKSLYQTENANWRTSARWVLQFLQAPLQRTEFGRAALATKETTAFLLRKD